MTDLSRTFLGPIRERFQRADDPDAPLRGIMLHAGADYAHRLGERPIQPTGKSASILDGGGSTVPAGRRLVYYIGTSAALARYEPVARDAGVALRGLPMAKLGLSDATQLENSDYFRWLWALFDLSWEPRPGQPLRTTKKLWSGTCTFPYGPLPKDWVMTPAIEHRRRKAGWEDHSPNCFCSELSNLFTASAFAIDILLAESRPNEVTVPARTKSSSGGAARTRQNREQVADAPGKTDQRVISEKPMTEGQRRLWNALYRRAANGPKLAKKLDTSEETIRQWVLDLRKAGREIKHRRGRGYYRLDAPPNDSNPT